VRITAAEQARNVRLLKLVTEADAAAILNILTGKCRDSIACGSRLRIIRACLWFERAGVSYLFFAYDFYPEKQVIPRFGEATRLFLWTAQ
jgi:hypothetical protein